MQLLGASELGYDIPLNTRRQEGQRRGRAARRPVASAVLLGCCCHDVSAAQKGAARTGSCPTRVGVLGAMLRVLRRQACSPGVRAGAAREHKAAAELRANCCRPRGHGGRPGRVATGPERSRRLLRSKGPGGTRRRGVSPLVDYHRHNTQPLHSTCHRARASGESGAAGHVGASTGPFFGASEGNCLPNRARGRQPG